MLVIQLKKTDYDTKVNEIEKKITDHTHDKYITTPEFNKLTAENFAARLILIMSYHGNLKDCLMKKSILSKQIIIYLIHTLIFTI